MPTVVNNHKAAWNAVGIAGDNAADIPKHISAREALAVLCSSDDRLSEVLSPAASLRHRVFGSLVTMCSIVNARCGACSEDCAFCAQSARHHTRVESFPLKSAAEIIRAREEAGRFPIARFGVVTSGRGCADRDVEVIAATMRANPSSGPTWCCSLGCLGEDKLRELKHAGMRRYHHNIETAESFFPHICTTHTYASRINTIAAAQGAGLEVCSGGILGMGETREQRVEMAMRLAELRVNSIPLNFLVPIAGTPLGSLQPMAPHDILRTIAMFRLVNPMADIRVCAGRSHLGGYQRMIFAAGANAIMIGPLLTIAGCNPNDDLRMLEELGLSPDRGQTADRGMA